MRKLAVYIAVLLMLLACTGLAESMDMDEQVDVAFRKARAVGGAFVVASHGNIVYERYYGVQQKTTGVPVTEKTYFKCASVTKFVTGIGLLKMMDEGILDADEDISTYLGYKVGNPRFKNKPITLRHLMSHTSGINEEGAYSKKSSILSDMIAVDKKAKANFRDVAPGAQYKYSNFGAGITGAIIEAVTGEDVSTFMRHYLFEPLGIDAAYTVHQLLEPEYIVATYLQDGDLYQAPSYMLRQEYDAVADPDHHYRTTVGSLLIRPRDLTRLGIAACGDGSVDGVQILSAEALRKMREPQSPEVTGITERSPYSFFCIRQDTVMKRRVYGHQGTSEGIVCNLYFEPESQLVICVMTNGCRSARDDGVISLTRRLAAIAEENYAD